MHIIPFLYLGARHMVTGYDHILFLLGVIFFLHGMKEIGIYMTLFAIGHSTTMLAGIWFDFGINSYIIDDHRVLGRLQGARQPRCFREMVRSPAEHQGLDADLRLPARLRARLEDHRPRHLAAPTTPAADEDVAAPAAPEALETAAAPLEPAAPVWRDEVTYTLAPTEGIEVKLVMEEGATAEFEWTANGAVLNHDTHGDGGGESVTYEQGRGVPGEQGELVAAFTGNHGWFWRNRTSEPVTFTLRTRGDYSEMRRPRYNGGVGGSLRRQLPDQQLVDQADD